MIFTVRVYVKNIEKYKGIYAISKIYLGLLRLPTLPLTLPLGKASQETKNKKKESGPSKKERIRPGPLLGLNGHKIIFLIKFSDKFF